MDNCETSMGIQFEDREEGTVEQWRFDETVAKIFDRHIRESVPFYNEIHRMTAEISDWFVRDSSLVYDLGTSTGEGVRRIFERHRKKNLRFVAVDISKDMMAKAREKLLDVPNVQFVVSDLNNPFPIENASLVMSIFTLQFVTPNSRPRLLRDIFNGLIEGGAFVLVEKVLGETPRIDEVWMDLHHDLKRRNSIDDHEIAVKSRTLRGILVPRSLPENMYLLRQVGFSEMDVFFKWYNWAGVLAIK